MWVPFVLLLFSIMFQSCNYDILFALTVAFIVMAYAECDGTVDFHVDNETLPNGTTRLFKPLKNGSFVVGCTRCMGRNRPIWFNAATNKAINRCGNVRNGVCTMINGINDRTLDLVFSMAVTRKYKCGSNSEQETINIQIFG